MPRAPGEETGIDSLSVTGPRAVQPAEILSPDLRKF